MNDDLRPHFYLHELRPYSSGLEHEDANAIRLSFNEGAFGPSPVAVAAFKDAIATMHRYPDMGYAQFRQALAKEFGVDATRIVCGAGSDELIGMLARTYAGCGDEIVYSQYGFAMYPIAAKSVGATRVPVPEKDFRTDVDGMIAAVTPNTRIIFIANPNNPTGSYLPFDEIRRLHAALPPGVLLVLDSAYADYMEAADYKDGIELVEQARNVVVLRTFSKIHALGGLRVGWAYASQGVADMLNRVRNPFNLAAPSVAAAIASLGDKDFLAKSRAHNAEWRDWLVRELSARNSFKVHPSVTNFVLIGLGNVERTQKLLKYMGECSIQIRPMGNYGLADHVRITIGREDEMRCVLDALTRFQD